MPDALTIWSLAVLVTGGLMYMAIPAIPATRLLPRWIACQDTTTRAQASGLPAVKQIEPVRIDLWPLVG